MADTKFAYRTSEIEQILDLDRSKECGACSRVEIDTARDLITALEYWWLSPYVRDIVRTHTYIEVHENPKKPSCSIRLKFENPVKPKVDHAVLIIIQHHLLGTPKVHYQLQFPNKDPFKHTPRSEFDLVALELVSEYEPKIDKYRVPDRVSISLEEPKHDDVLLDIQKQVLEYVQRLIQLSQQYSD